MKKFFSLLIAILFCAISVSAQTLKGDMNDDGLLTIEDIVLTTNEVLNFREGVAKTPTSISTPLTKKYRVGDTIEPSLIITPPDAPVVYSWYRTDVKNVTPNSAVKISGATSSTYTLTDADEGKYIIFRAEVVEDAVYKPTLYTNITQEKVQKPAPKIYFGMTHYWSKVRTGKTNLKDTLLLGNLPDNKMVATVENNVFTIGAKPFGSVSGMACQWFAVPNGTKIVRGVDSDNDEVFSGDEWLITSSDLDGTSVNISVDGTVYKVYSNKSDGLAYNPEYICKVTIE